MFMSNCEITLFYENPVQCDSEQIAKVVIDNNLDWDFYSESGFYITINNNLSENLEKLLADNMGDYPNSVLALDKISERVVKSTVKEKGGIFAGLGDSEDLTFMRKINYGIQKSDFYRALEVSGYACKSIGF